MNKKAQENTLVPIIIFIGIFALIIGAALLMGIGTGVLTFFSTTINQATAGLGDISGTNMTKVQEMTIGTLDDTIQMATWGSAVVLIVSLLGLLIFAAYIKTNRSGALIGMYFILVMVLIIISIFVSNIYEEFYNDNGDIGLELKQMTVTSFIILYLPHIVTTIAFIGGIIMFSGVGNEIV